MESYQKYLKDCSGVKNEDYLQNYYPQNYYPQNYYQEKCEKLQQENDNLKYEVRKLTKEYQRLLHQMNTRF